MAGVSKTVSIPLGPLVDVESHDEICSVAGAKLPDRGHRELFAVGWNGLAYRARGAADHADAFDRLCTVEPTPEVQFQQDDELFAFVANASAASESLVFSSYVVARAFDDGDLTDPDIARSIEKMLPCIAKVPHTKAIAEQIEKATGDVDGRALADLRNVHLHRGRLLRHYWVGGRHHGKVTVPSNPKQVPSAWQPDRYLEAGGLEA